MIPCSPTLAQSHRPLFLLRHSGKLPFVPPGQEAAEIGARPCIVALCEALLAAKTILLVFLLALVVDSVGGLPGLDLESLTASSRATSNISASFVRSVPAPWRSIARSGGLEE